MSEPVYKRLLAGLLDTLGPEWHRAQADLIYRTDKKYLVQCISCKSSSFSRDYVPSTFIHVLARNDDHLRIDFGGRLRTPRTGFLGLKQPRDLWLDGSIDPPLSDVLRLAAAQACVPLDAPLTTEAVAAHVERSKKASFEHGQWWSAGIVYGLCGRTDHARNCLDRARKQLETLQASFENDGVAAGESLPKALADIGHARRLLDDPKQFSAWCSANAAQSARALGLKAFG